MDSITLVSLSTWLTCMFLHRLRPTNQMLEHIPCTNHSPDSTLTRPSGGLTGAEILKLSLPYVAFV